MRSVLFLCQPLLAFSGFEHCDDYCHHHWQSESILTNTYTITRNTLCGTSRQARLLSFSITAILLCNLYVIVCSAGFLTVGFVAFPMPEVFPRHYWLFHSIWHVCLAAGYYELYALIEQDSHKGQTVQRANQKSVAKMKKKDLSTMHNVASNSSLESSSELATLKHRVAPQVWSHAMHTTVLR